MMYIYMSQYMYFLYPLRLDLRYNKISQISSAQDFRKKLKETGDRDLVWENELDTFWGAKKGRGQNYLGRDLALFLSFLI